MAGWFKRASDTKTKLIPTQNDLRERRAGDFGQVDDLVNAEKVLGKTHYDLSPAFMADQFRLDDEQVCPATASSTGLSA